jgi:hypothetical protein
VIELADIFRLAGPAYRAVYRLRMLASHLRAMRDIEACRTAALGGQLRQCDRCDSPRYSYHSCRNRHCPKCHREQTDRWLTIQQRRLLPCAYFLATFTLPAELRALARSSQKIFYAALMTAAAGSLLKLCRDPRHLGARPGLLAVLHTWTRDLRYHPHVHILVTAGGWREGHDPAWVQPKHPEFLLPARVLSVVFRAKMRDALRKAGILSSTPTRIWRKDWVVHLKHAGSGERALAYLARYVFRVALVNGRIERFDPADGVTFRYRDNRTREIKHCTLATNRFIARFLQHVLPKGFSKVRSYGLFSPRLRDRLERAKAVLLRGRKDGEDHADTSTALHATDEPSPAAGHHAKEIRCPVCKTGILRVVATIPRWRPPP